MRSEASTMGDLNKLNQFHVSMWLKNKKILITIEKYSNFNKK